MNISVVQDSTMSTGLRASMRETTASSFITVEDEEAGDDGLLRGRTTLIKSTTTNEENAGRHGRYQGAR